jgi:hypothetical protein
MVVLVNRAKMGTATTGTGTITLGSAESGYQTFADAGVTNGQVVRYVIEDGTNWEIGSGTYTASGTTLSRTVSESSNAGSAINLSGSAVVYVSATAEDIPSLYAENPSSPTAPSATGTNAVAIGSGASAGGYGFAAGLSASASGNYSVAIGRSASATQNYTTAIGYNSDADGSSSISIGLNTTAGSTYSTALGVSSAGGGSQTATGLGAMALGGSYASGTDSFAAAIANNFLTYGANGANSVAIGDRAKANNSDSFALGNLAGASGTDSFALGTLTTASGASSYSLGYQSTASQDHTFAIGYRAEATEDFAVAIGKEAKSIIYGKHAQGSGIFVTKGDAQAGIFILRSDTTSSTAEALTTNNSTAGTTNQIILPNNSAYAFHGTIVARQQASAGTACAAWKIEGLIRREGSAGTTVLVNSATTVLDNTPGWGMALSADTTNGGLKIEVTGAAATNIRWVATVHTSEVTY